MAGITGQSTTFGLPNFVGELYALTPEDTPFLSAIGGLTGGESTDATIFGWQNYDLRDASQNVRLEGADAQTAEARVRAYAFNVVQIHQETIETSYTKMAAVGQFEGTGSNHGYADGVSGSNPVSNEHDWQTMQMLKQIARDIEYSFVNGSFQEPANNSTARQTRGILEAISTNAVDKTTSQGTNATGVASTDILTDTSHGLTTGDQILITTLAGGTGLAVGDVYFIEGIDANTFYLSTSRTGETGGRVNFTTDITDLDYDVLTEPTAEAILDLLQDVWDVGGIQESEYRTIMVNSGLKRYLTKLFITDGNYREMSRTIGGVSVDSFMTDFGNMNVMLNRFMPKTKLAVVSLEQCAPVHLLIPGKGFLFKEPLGKLGAAELDQIYGEIGLKYGNELAHGKISGFHGRYNPSA